MCLLCRTDGKKVLYFRKISEIRVLLSECHQEDVKGESKIVGDLMKSLNEAANKNKKELSEKAQALIWNDHFLFLKRNAHITMAKSRLNVK